MTAAPLPFTSADDVANLRAALAQAEARADAAEAEAARAKAMASNTEALIASLKLEIEKLRRELYGTRSERKARLLDTIPRGDAPDTGQGPPGGIEETEAAEAAAEAAREALTGSDRSEPRRPGSEVPAE